MRYIIYGAGAIGGSIGARLFQNRHDAILICRGAHLKAVQRDGLRLRTPDESVTLAIPAVGHPSEIDFRDDDVVLLTMKSQHTADALDALRPAAGDVPVVCAQNGVANERMAARRFSRVYGMLVVLPATHLEPGQVVMNAAPIGGVLDAGVFPKGVDPLIEQVTMDLNASGFGARPDEEIMRLKYAKLLENLANIVQALVGLEMPGGELIRAVRAEGIACLRAAGIDSAPESEMNDRRSEVLRGLRPIEGQRRGGSTWQSLTRAAGSVETDFLNGEIALLGALLGVPTPYNRMLQRIAVEALREGRAPGSYSVDELMARAHELTTATHAAKLQ